MASVFPLERNDKLFSSVVNYLIWKIGIAK